MRDMWLYMFRHFTPQSHHTHILHPLSTPTHTHRTHTHQTADELSCSIVLRQGINSTIQRLNCLFDKIIDELGGHFSLFVFVFAFAFALVYVCVVLVFASCCVCVYVSGEAQDQIGLKERSS